MRNEYLNKVEDNASNKLQELRDIWAQWDDESKQLFYQNYGDLPYLLNIKVDRHLFRAMAQFWNPAYSCFTFGNVDLIPILEEYTTLLRCPRIQGHKAYVRPASSCAKPGRTKVRFKNSCDQDMPQGAPVVQWQQRVSLAERLWVRSHGEANSISFFKKRARTKAGKVDEVWSSSLISRRNGWVFAARMGKELESDQTPSSVLKRCKQDIVRDLGSSRRKTGVYRTPFLCSNRNAATVECRVGWVEIFPTWSVGLVRGSVAVSPKWWTWSWAGFRVAMKNNSGLDPGRAWYLSSPTDSPPLLWLSTWVLHSKCISWAVLRDLISKHPDVKKRVDVLALSIYGIVIFPKALGHIYEAVADLFDQIGKQNTPLLLVWFHSHFWKLDKVPCRVFFEDYSPLKEAVDMPRRDEISEEKWIDIFQNLRYEDVMWKAPWLVPSEVLYRCGSFDWVPLPGIWGVVGYAPFLVLRQYRARQFIPATQGLAQSDFLYKRDNYKKRIREISESWKKPIYMKILTEGSMSTPEYRVWFNRRVNDNVPRPILGVARSSEESLRVIPSELEVMKQEFERKNLELEKRIEKLEEEKNVLKSRR
ncbi:hypothetical protein CXB51_028124 [Gossypium anomalum]|uniref:DUF7745 domain-containing protein n=1 Tax=Gossypium anomalum TaxID=47600 RepID=A0A8J5Y6V8_9ROSI|nr:hypothetical protein CXB51_028124 [Gossypium anomalum]